jgi:hypothetical protein
VTQEVEQNCSRALNGMVGVHIHAVIAMAVCAMYAYTVQLVSSASLQGPRLLAAKSSPVVCYVCLYGHDSLSVLRCW